MDEVFLLCRLSNTVWFCPRAGCATRLLHFSYALTGTHIPSFLVVSIRRGHRYAAMHPHPSVGAMCSGN